MRTDFVSTFRIIKRAILLLILLTALVYAQTQVITGFAQIEGVVRDSQSHPIADAAVSLESSGPTYKKTVKTDSQGRFHFDAVRPAGYVLRIAAQGFEEQVDGSLVLRPDEVRACSFVLVRKNAAAKDAANAVQFSDEPAFTVAGVTDVTEYGSHGSARFMHNRDALSKEAVSLGSGPKEPSNASAGSAGEKEAAIRASLAEQDNADLRAQLAEIEESDGRFLDAVRDYQRAAEMQPSEAHQFVWGAELLLHHAYEPAIIVFTQGRRLYPDSTRMLLGLGTATYASGSPKAAEKIFGEACDLDPSNPTPYVFLWKLQAVENVDAAAWLQRIKRFVSLHPENAMAHFLYAVALRMQQSENQGDLEVVESQLKTAISLDPRLGDAYLQLGTLYADRGNLADAITMLQHAVEFMPSPEQAHYRLAQIYRQRGEFDKARDETEQFKQITQQKDNEAEREHREIRQFVYTLRNQNSPAPGPPNAH